MLTVHSVIIKLNATCTTPYSACMSPCREYPYAYWILYTRHSILSHDHLWPAALAYLACAKAQNRTEWGGRELGPLWISGQMRDRLQTGTCEWPQMTHIWYAIKVWQEISVKNMTYSAQNRRNFLLVKVWEFSLFSTVSSFDQYRTFIGVYRISSFFDQYIIFIWVRSVEVWCEQ